MSVLWNKRRLAIDIPDYIQNRIKDNASSKIEILKYTPPIPWVQFNDWQVCCDDYMQYIGEWEQKDFIKEAILLHMYFNVLIVGK